MQAKIELLKLKERIRRQIITLESELATVDRTIELLERENPQSGAAAENQHRDRRFAKLGLSDAIRQVIAGEWLTPSEVRDELLRGGYAIDDKKKLLGYVFATAKRLAEKGDLEGSKVEGRLKYRKRALTTVREAA